MKHFCRAKKRKLHIEELECVVSPKAFCHIRDGKLGGITGCSVFMAVKSSKKGVCSI